MIRPSEELSRRIRWVMTLLLLLSSLVIGRNSTGASVGFDVCFFMLLFILFKCFPCFESKLLRPNNVITRCDGVLNHLKLNLCSDPLEMSTNVYKSLESTNSPSNAEKTWPYREKALVGCKHTGKFPRKKKRKMCRSTLLSGQKLWVAHTFTNIERWYVSIL